MEREQEQERIVTGNEKGNILGNRTERQNGQRCQVRVYSGKGSGQVRMEMDEGREQRAGQEVSPAGVGDRVDSTTKDNER